MQESNINNDNSNTSRINFIIKIYILSVVMEPFYMFVLAPQDITGIGLSVSRILQFIVCASLFLKFFSSKRDRDRILNSFSPLNNNITYYFIFTILVGFLGLYTGSYSFNIESSTQVINNSIIADFILSLSFRPFIEYVIAFYYFVYFVVLAIYMLTSKEAIDYFFRIFGIAFLICIVLGYLDYLYMSIYWHESGGYLLPRHLADGDKAGFRFHGIAGEPRDAFSYLMLSLGIFALRDIWEDKKKLTLFWIILIITSAFLTESFSGILGIVFFGILVMIYYLPIASSNMFTNVTMKLLLLSMYLLVALIIFINILVFPRIFIYYQGLFELYSILDGGLSLKDTIYRYTMNNVYPIWHLWTEVREFNFLHLIIGNGLGSTPAINQYYMHSNEMINPNANIIRTLYETGIIGTLLFISVFLTPIKKMYMNSTIYSKLIILMLLMLGMYFAHRSAIPYIFLGVVLAVLKSKLRSSGNNSQE